MKTAYRFVYAVLFMVAISVVIFLHISSYNQYSLLDIVRSNYETIPYFHTHEGRKNEVLQQLTQLHVLDSSRLSQLSTKDHIVIFPKHFDLGELSPSKYYARHFNEDGTDVLAVQLSESGMPSSSTALPKVLYRPNKLEVFQSSGLSNEPACESLHRSITIGTSDKVPLLKLMHDAVVAFKEEDSAYYRELEPFWRDDIDEQIASRTVDQYWYRLAGTSVWLEEYGVHYMISRVVYSPTGVRNAPVVSLTYAQVFNDKWEELQNVELIVPSNNPDIGNELMLEEQIYANVKFPSFLPVPAFHDEDEMRGRYYGPEDPRLLLVKNPKGYEEPLMVFNAYQRKIWSTTPIDYSHANISFAYYRVMFMCWPWQYQRGKAVVDEAGGTQYNFQRYSRIAELRRQNFPQVNIQKNWTPFVSFSSRLEHDYDRYIYFVYRWKNLEVFRCDLSSLASGVSNCVFDYRLNENLPEKTYVGSLRGGTELINVNQLLHKYSGRYSDLHTIVSSIPPTREIWLGFARAHFRGCGCGQDTYRPNMVVLTKDTVKHKMKLKSGDYKTVTKPVYKISHMSSFFSLNIPQIGWEIDHPEKVCAAGMPSVLIPNGISDWNLQEVKVPSKDGDVVGLQDYLTLSLSIGDYTVDLVHIRGLLNEFFQLDLSLDIQHDGNRIFGGKYLGKEITLSQLVEHGFNDNNLECALDESWTYCREYGRTHGGWHEPEKKEEEKEEKVKSLTSKRELSLKSEELSLKTKQPTSSKNSQELS